ncbi:MAG: hypothetical protein C4521_05185 [Actinobacteria bacterium]|jgi:hypothetical protein|nr:MAG: hypothetical protein C4521_05185 [Actinomycetota bacterium]
MAKRKKQTQGEALYADILASLPEDRRDDKMLLRVARELADLEGLKEAHQKDIKKRGVVERVKNGAQEFHRANPSVGQVLRIIAEQRRLRAQLRLKATLEEVEDLTSEEIQQALERGRR